MPSCAARVRRELDADVVLDLRGLAIDGDDLIAELGLSPGPELGRILDALLERVIADPSINRRPIPARRGPRPARRGRLVIELLLEAERALSFGLVDRAEHLYRQVADADPKNSIAVVGLARVALEHDDDAGALAYARQALAIDPENDAARRLVERMTEVLETRGESTEPAEPPPTPPATEPTQPMPTAQEGPARLAPPAPPIQPHQPPGRAHRPNHRPSEPGVTDSSVAEPVSFAA